MVTFKTFTLLICVISHGTSSRADTSADVSHQAKKSISAFAGIVSVLDVWRSIGIDKETGIEELVKQLYPGSLPNQIDALDSTSGPALTTVLTSVKWMSKFNARFAFPSSFIDFTFNAPREEKVTLRQQFAKVNEKLNLISLQNSSLQFDPKWETCLRVYSRDESEIEQAWQSFFEFVDKTLNAGTEKESSRLATRFTGIYESTTIGKNISNFQTYLTRDATPLGGRLLDLVNEKFRGDFRVLMRFSAHATSLALRALLLDLYHRVLTGSHETLEAQEAAKKFNEVLAAVENAILECLNNYLRFLQEDLEELNEKSSGWVLSEVFATAIQLINHKMEPAYRSQTQQQSSAGAIEMFYGQACEKRVLDNVAWKRIRSKTDAVLLRPVQDLPLLFLDSKALKEFSNLLIQSLQTGVEFSQIFTGVEYSEIMFHYRQIVFRHSLLESGAISQPLFVSEVNTQFCNGSFLELVNRVNNMANGIGFRNKTNILCIYLNFINSKSAEPFIKCSKEYVDTIDYFVRYLLTLQKDAFLAWFKYLLLTNRSQEIPEVEMLFQSIISSQWRLFNSNGCQSLKAQFLSNSYCEKPYHSACDFDVPPNCLNAYKPFPKSVTCSAGVWSPMPLCFTHPKNGETQCNLESGEIICRASCQQHHVFSDGQSSKTYQCGHQPCEAVSPPNCDGCMNSDSCRGDYVCKGGACLDGCITGTNPCGPNSVCSTSNHIQTCTCKTGWSGDNPRLCQYRALQWVYTDKIPPNAVKSEFQLHVCRAKDRDDSAWHGGELFCSHASCSCSYEYGGRKKTERRFYEMLVDPCGGRGTEWRTQWPINYYICRALYGGVWHLGKLFNTRRGWICHIAVGIQGFTIGVFDSLVQQPCIQHTN
ncbi:hypothetical protein SKAU_G00190200 [Synaphobranchus kaupii]|uniref:EGF-like domain-containing protein n=1 Tax=Synaphobranchus kaupii TaxID=118154 RepID=A0A9Q1FDK6_SYNKA|nr:hypothetical protein SKAU_G00190200 [Synaphobranchus kaupii]